MADPVPADPCDGDVRKIDAERVDPAADDIEKVDVEQELLEDIQGSREVEAILRRLIAPPAADVEEGDTAAVGPAVAYAEKADRAPAGPHDDDPGETPAVLAVRGEDRHPNPQLLEQPAPTPASALVEGEEIPTRQIPGVELPRQQLSTQEMADPTADDPGAVDAHKGDGEKELAEDGPNDAQSYRTRVEEAQLPGDVRDAALREVDKLGRASDQSPDSGDIRIWLDTILELPWGTKTADWTAIQGSREAEATLRKLIEPAVADMEEGVTAGGVAVVADTEKDNRAPADPHD